MICIKFHQKICKKPKLFTFEVFKPKNLGFSKPFPDTYGLDWGLMDGKSYSLTIL